jgi:hypothetical protein
VLLAIPCWKDPSHVYFRIGWALSELEPAVVECVVVSIGLKALGCTTPSEGIAREVPEGTCTEFNLHEAKALHEGCLKGPAQKCIKAD